MNKLNKLIKELCPNGVEYKKLGDIGVFFGGLSGKSKEDFIDGNAKFITYKNIYSNPSLNVNMEDKVKICAGEKQNIVRLGDILFTGSSETPDECGMSSVVTTPTDEELYLNSFCFGLRLNNIEDFNLHYLKHLLRSNEIRNQIKQTASGVTRYNVSKKRFANVSIPLPPLAVQEEIVKILDRFAEYTAELQAELQARKEQYEYYRNLLLTNNFAYGSADGKQKITGNARGEWKWMTLGEVCEICPGKDYKHLSNGEIPVYGSGGVMTFVDSFVYEEPTVLLPRKGSISNVFYVDKPFWNVDTIYYTKIDKSKILPKYFYYLVVNEHIEKYNTSNAARPALTRDVLRKIKLLIPSLELQQRIVTILDKFEALVSDLTQGLPAEIAASQERYEYYRDKLLRFERCN